MRKSVVGTVRQRLACIFKDVMDKDPRDDLRELLKAKKAQRKEQEATKAAAASVAPALEPAEQDRQPLGLRELLQNNEHEAVLDGGRWKCGRCSGGISNAPRMFNVLKRWLKGSCPVKSASASFTGFALKPTEGEVQVGNGKVHPSHRAHFYTSSGTWACVTCGVYANGDSLRGLAKPCTRVLGKYGREVLSRLRDGRHPRDRQKKK